MDPVKSSNLLGYDCDSLALERYSAFVAHYTSLTFDDGQMRTSSPYEGVNIAPLTAIEPVQINSSMELDATGDRGAGSEDAERSSTFRSAAKLQKLVGKLDYVSTLLS